MAVGSALVTAGDDQLLAQAARGQAPALDELFRRYRSLAYRVAHRLLGNEADALDAVQDAFIKAFTHLSEFQGRSSFKTWLLRIVSNSALDLVRRRNRHETLSMDALSPERRENLEPASDASPALDLERDDLRRLLQNALNRLPAAQRQTFVLHAEAELTYREVAEVLGISIGTVMSRLYYARVKLRPLLETWTRAT